MPLETKGQRIEKLCKQSTSRQALGGGRNVLVVLETGITQKSISILKDVA